MEWEMQNYDEQMHNTHVQNKMHTISPYIHGHGQAFDNTPVTINHQ